MVMMIAPRARWKPAESAIALPKFLRRRTPFTRGVAGAEPGDHLPGVVGAPVVHEDDLVGAAPGEALADAQRQLGQAVGLVDTRDDNRNLGDDLQPRGRQRGGLQGEAGRGHLVDDAPLRRRFAVRQGLLDSLRYRHRRAG